MSPSTPLHATSSTRVRDGKQPLAQHLMTALVLIGQPRAGDVDSIVEDARTQPLHPCVEARLANAPSHVGDPMRHLQLNEHDRALGQIR